MSLYTFADGEILTAAKVNSYLVNPEDTGWVTTGLTITPTSAFTINSYRLRRTGGRVIGQVLATTSATITANADGFVTSATAFNLPSGWGSSGGTPVFIRCGGIWEGLVTGAVVTINAGPPGRTMPTAAGTFTFDHMTD